MSKFFRRATFAALTCLVTSMAGMAQGATVYTQTGNDGTRTLTDLTTNGFTITNVSGPFGVASVNTIAGNLVISFTTNPAVFAASANNTDGGHQAEFDGKINFTLTFDSAVLLNPILNEGGSWSKTGTSGILQVVAGGTVTEIDDLAQTQIGQTLSLNTFSGDSWSLNNNLGAFQIAYKSYNFSLDNYLLAVATTSDTPSSASIDKNTFSITIPGGGGAPNATPVPAALWTGLGMLPFLYLMRRRLA